MEIFAIAFSTFLGAAVALAAERLTRLYDARVKEEAAINGLILDLAAKRAFLVPDDWDWADGEIDRIVGSITHARTLIRETRLASRPRSKVLPPLRRMTRACNSFLEWSERADDESLKSALKALTTKMSGEVQALHAIRPDRIMADAPGSFSLEPIS